MARRAKNSLSPLYMQLLKGLLFLLIGIALIVQPWLEGISWLGWLMVAVAVLVAAATAVRLVNAARMQKKVIAQFDCGDAVYENGLKIGGVLYDFSTFGAQLSGADCDGEKLRFQYSFYARRGGRTGEIVSIPIGEGEADKAQEVLARLGLPGIEEPAEAQDEQAGEAQPEETALPGPESREE